jgi:flagellar motor switch/type III secretory pathway protein FliN
MTMQPFTLLGAAQYASLCTAIHTDVQAWLDGWIYPPPTAKMAVDAISQGFDADRRSEGIRFTDGSGEQWAVVRFDQAARQKLCDRLLAGQDTSAASSGPTDLVSGMAESALLDLIAHVLPPAEGEYIKSGEDTVEACIPDSAFQPGNEAVHLKIDIDGLGLHIWLPVRPFADRITFPSPTQDIKSEELVAPREALSKQPMRFKVMLGSADLTLGAVANLRIGDVIHLDKDLQDPLTLIFDHSPARFAGYLGKMRDCYSFQIDGLLSKSDADGSTN